MANLSRRDCMRGSLALLAGAGVGLGASAATTEGSGGIQLALHLGVDQADRLLLASQIGVRHVISDVSHALRQVSHAAYADTLAGIQKRFADAGLTLAGVEGHPVPAEKIKLGIAGRDEQIDDYVAAIEALGQVGVPMVCYNFMAGLGWYRTRTDVLERGGALTSEFDVKDAEAQGLTEWGEVSEETMWDNMERFLKAVIPVAEKAGVKMAAHPDDPPLPRLRGIARILISADSFRRVMATVPSPVNGVTFCQANFKAMGEDIEALAAEWCRAKKIFFVHLRDIEGNRERFRETFHDNGPTDMARMMKIYHENGFVGPMRPDHAPTLVGEANNTPGYAMLGRILAIGYMKGLLEGQAIPYQ
jgi:mannonate dehydratase